MCRSFYKFCLVFAVFTASYAAEWTPSLPFPEFDFVGRGVQWDGTPWNPPSDPSALRGLPSYTWEQLIRPIEIDALVVFKTSVFDVLGDVDTSYRYLLHNVPSLSSGCLVMEAGPSDLSEFTDASFDDNNSAFLSEIDAQPISNSLQLSVIPEPFALGLLGAGGFTLLLLKRLGRRSS